MELSSLPCLLAQVAERTARDVEPGAIVPAVLLLTFCLLVIAALIVGRRVQQQRHDQRLRRVIDRCAFISAGSERWEVAQSHVRSVVGKGALLGEVFVREAEAFDVHLVVFRFPRYRIERDGSWNPLMQESDRQVMLLFVTPERDFPVFRMMPNNWAVNLLSGKRQNIFARVQPFGWWNYVSSADADAVQRLIDGYVQHLLRGNKRLVVDSRPGVLACYRLDGAWLPRDAVPFVEQCWRVAETLCERHDAAED